MTSPSTSPLRKSFSSILTKITSRPSIDGNPDISKSMKASSQPCNVCGNKTKKNIQCRQCSKISCILHSSATSTSTLERTCDECIHITILNEISQPSLIKDKITLQIQELVTKRDQTTKILNRENTKAKGLENQIKEVAGKAESAKTDVFNKIKSTQKENSELQIDLKNWESESSKIKAINERNQRQLIQIEKEGEHYRVAIEEMMKERTELLANLNEVRDFIRLQVPVKIIKRIICSSCFVKVQHGFTHIFKNVVPVKPEPEVQERPKRQGTCASCDLF